MRTQWPSARHLGRPLLPTLIKRLDLAIELEGHGAAEAVFGITGGDPDPTFRDAGIAATRKFRACVGTRQYSC